jgi:hypothetical protein
MYRILKPNIYRYLSVWLFMIVICIGFFTGNASYAATILENRSDTLSTSANGVTATHTIGFTYGNLTTPVGSIIFQFCANDPIITDVCTTVPGMVLSGAKLTAQTGEVNFGLSYVTNNSIVLSRDPTIPTNPASTYSLSNIINPSSPGSYFLRIQTFASADGSGPAIEYGGVAWAIVPVFTVVSQVLPYLTFCTGVSISGINCNNPTGDQINFGNFSTHSTASATSQFVAASNARNGYSTTVIGTTMTSGNDIIPSLDTATTSKAGVSQFGMNLVADGSPLTGDDPDGPGTAVPSAAYGNSNEYLFNSGDTVADSTGPSDYKKFTASYIVNVSSTQPTGVYATTITFICLANF